VYPNIGQQALSGIKADFNAFLRDKGPNYMQTTAKNNKLVSTWGQTPTILQDSVRKSDRVVHPTKGASSFSAELDKRIESQESHLRKE
jgi:hypothetical protein